MYAISSLLTEREYKKTQTVTHDCLRLFCYLEVFALPGVAQLSIQAIRNNDYPLCTGGCILTTFNITFILVFMDIFIALLDPRVKASYSAK